MKRTNTMLAIGAVVSLLAASSAWATGPEGKNPCGNSGNNCNIGSVSTGGSVTGTITNTTTGGNAVVGDVTGVRGNVTGGAGGTVWGSGNSTNANTALGGLGGSAVNGAITNTNTANGGAGGLGGAGGTATTGAITNTNNSSATGGSVGNITVNAYDPNAAGENASATRDAAAISANTSTTYSGKVEVVTPGVASVPNIYPTSPCMGSTSAGVSFMGGAVSGGSSWKDDDCSYRETARMFDQLGYKKDGLAVMCESAYAKAAPSCKAIEAQKAAEAEKAEKAKAAEPTTDGSAVNTDKRLNDATVKTSLYMGG